MAVSASTVKFLPKRGQIKNRIFKMIAKSLQKGANGVAGGEKKAAGNGQGLKYSGSKRAVKRNLPKRGQTKIKIIKMFAKSLADLAIGVAGSCSRSPATVSPVEVLAELESVTDALESEGKKE